MLCQTFPENYTVQLADKVKRLTHLLGELTPLPELEVFESSRSHYRARAEFRVWHEGDRTDYIMFNPETKQKVAIEACPMALESIAKLMPQLMAEIMAQPILRTKLFQVDFLATLSGQMLVTLIYRKSLQNEAGHADSHWVAAAEGLKSRLPIDHIIGRARKQKICLSQDWITETLKVEGQAFHYQQVENSFTQPNAMMAQNMLSWARAQALKANPDQQGDLIELYCGNGHFSIALAERYRNVLATEISKTSVASAQVNIAANQIENLTVVKLAAEEISQALQGQRQFKRLAGVTLENYQFNTIFVDPPRSGLDDLTRKMVASYDHILYISCNPETLARDLVQLLDTHKVVACALFDQFPYTDHIESGVYLERA